MDANIPTPQDVNSKLKQSPTAAGAPSQTKLHKIGTKKIYYSVSQK